VIERISDDVWPLIEAELAGDPCITAEEFSAAVAKFEELLDPE
jgi:hypothetical protein